jgi:PAS domain S-box-containing protein
MTKDEGDGAMTERLTDSDVLLSILDNLPTSIFVKDEELRFVYSNKLHCAMIGKAEPELLGKCDFDFYPVEDANAFSARDREVVDTGDESISEEMACREDGMNTPVVTRKVRLEGPNGEIYLIGTNSDLTDIKKRENQYRALSETVPVGVAQIDENLDISFANPLFNAYCGGDGSETDQSRMITKLREANPVFPGQACKFETIVQGLGNQPRTVIVISSGWLDLGDVIRSATVSLIDISQMSELQRINEEVSRLNRELATNVRKLSDAQDELIKKGRMEQLGQLTATVAHELRNPLGAVRTSAFLLERKLKDKGMGVEAQLDRINKGIVRCDNIITQLLDFSRSKQLQCTPGDLDEWLTGVVEEEAKKLPVQVSVELLLGLDGETVPFDPSRLERAVINMINNAVEAMTGTVEQVNAGAVAEPKLTISTFMKKGHVSLRVIDNGPGITPDVLTRIREPLFTTKSFGTGLGVPAIEQIAVQHGGRLDIRSEVGVGSSFTVWLPATGAQADEKAA